MSLRRKIALPSRLTVLNGVIRAVVVVAVLLNARSLPAVLVGTTPNVVPDTSSNPVNNPTWAASGKGDPGWANHGATSSALNGIYLGNGWILTANHVGVSGITFANSATVHQPIPNQSFQVANPTGVSGLTQPFSDLRLYRIKTDPGLPSLTISSQTLTLNSEVVFVTGGVHRALAESFWTTDNADPPNWTNVGSCVVDNNHCFAGYYPSGAGRSWGTNNVADDSILGGPDASDANITAILGEHSIVNLTLYDRFSSNPFEAQVVGGDSGSPVYYKRNGQWELAGVVLANYIFAGQDKLFNNSNTTAVYGNASAFADLSAYRAEILNIMNSHSNFSVMGDVNLDGVVSGNGTGSATTDDVTAFVQGWNWQQATANVESWKKGDLNLDGTTNVNDFFLMRSALTTAGLGVGASALSNLFTPGAVPEPSTIALVLAATGFALGARRSRN